MAILVVNKKTHKQCNDDVYVGRPAPLGNPFAMKTEADRAKVIKQYEEWLNAHWNWPGPRDQLQMLKHRVILGMNIHLVCWCAPLPCHADIIKRVVEELANHG